MFSKLIKNTFFLVILIVLTSFCQKAEDRDQFDNEDVVIFQEITPVIGFATEIDGGLGHHIYRVVNLNDSGSGSLRDGLKEGNRIIVFEVGGAIKLQSDLGVNFHNVTLAGETAPSPGITLQGKSLQIRGSNIVVSHIAVERGHDPSNTNNADGIQFVATGRSIRNVYIDHCLAAWGLDEGMQLFISQGTKDGPIDKISISNCIFTEPLDFPPNLGYAPNDKNVRHGYNVLLSDYITNVDFQKNLCANGTMRNPRLGFGTKIICANNIVLNWGTSAISWEKNCDRAIYSTVIGNLGISGPNTSGQAFIAFWQKAPDSTFVHVSDNSVWKGHESKVSPIAEVFHRQGAPEGFKLMADRPLDLPDLKAVVPEVLYQQIMDNVGPRPKDRKNPVAIRAVKQLKDKTGRIIDHESQVGGFSILPSTSRRLTGELAPPIDFTNKESMRQWLNKMKRSVQYD